MPMLSMKPTDTFPHALRLTQMLLLLFALGLTAALVPALNLSLPVS